MMLKNKNFCVEIIKKACQNLLCSSIIMISFATWIILFSFLMTYFRLGLEYSIYYIHLALVISMSLGGMIIKNFKENFYVPLMNMLIFIVILYFLTDEFCINTTFMIATLIAYLSFIIGYTLKTLMFKNKREKMVMNIDDI